MHLPRPFKTTSFRLASGYAALFVASVLLIMAATYVGATSALKETIRASIDEDIKAFRQAFASGGDDALQEMVAERSESAPDDRFLLLLDAHGSAKAGNLSADLWRRGWRQRHLDADEVLRHPDLKVAASRNVDRDVRLWSFGEQIGPYRVLAARDAYLLDQMQAIIVTAFGWGGLATTLLALIGGYVMSLGPTRRVDEIALTTRKIVEGRLDLRLPVSPRGTELDRLAFDINRMLARIELLLESLKQVSTDIAHDLRTPLARLRQGLEVVRRQPRANDVYRVAIDGAMAESDAILETFNALLGIAQIEGGARRAGFKALDLSALAEKIVDIYAEVAFDAGHSLRASIEPAILVKGDGSLLTQAIANLIDNCINHVPPPGRIELRLHRRQGKALLEICDDGPGVPEAERDKIFRRLYRVDRSRSTPGNGLGLALVAAIAELHDATVEASDNRPGLLMRMTFAADGTDRRVPHHRSVWEA